MEQKPLSKGYATIGTATATRQQVEILDFVQATFADNRVASTVELVDDTFILSIENPFSSGRNPHQSIRVGRESFIGLLLTSFLYLDGKGINVAELLAKAIGNEELNYSFSEGIKPTFGRDTTPKPDAS